MTKDLQRIWRKWLFYRNLLAVFFALNVFCVISGFVLSFNYWGFKQDLRDRHEAELRRLVATADLERQIAVLEEHLTATPSHTRSALIQEVKDWQILRVQLEAARLEAKHPLPDSLFNEPRAGLAYLTDLKTDLAEQRQATYAELARMVGSYSNTIWEIVAVGALTLLFGVIVPAFILWMMKRLLSRTLEQMRATARELVADWTRQRAKFGQEAFRNVEFWVEIALLAAQYTGRSARHPMAQLAGELAHLIRQELERSRTAKAA